MTRICVVFFCSLLALGFSCNEPSKDALKNAGRNAEIAGAALQDAILKAESDTTLHVIGNDLIQVAIHTDSAAYWLSGGKVRGGHPVTRCLEYCGANSKTSPSLDCVARCARAKVYKFKTQ